MGRGLFLKLTPLTKVLNMLKMNIKPCGTEEVHLEEALGRVASEDLAAKYPYPPFNFSEMDGYAVRAEDTYGAREDKPIALELIGEALAGGRDVCKVKPGGCIKIATGAMIPEGCSAVVPLEHTETEGKNVLVYKSVAPGENIAQLGGDIQKGEVIVRRGARIRPWDIALLAAVGYEKVSVYKRPSIGVIASGSELKPAGTPLDRAEMYDVNSPFLIAELRSRGYKVKWYGIIGDCQDEISKALAKATTENNLVLVTGGSSKGMHDLVPGAIENIGGKVLAHGIRTKPGKPTVVGKMGETIVLGLPGYPVSCIITFYMLVIPVLSMMEGEIADRKVAKAFLSEDASLALGRVNFIPVKLMAGERLAAQPLRMRTARLSQLMEMETIAVASGKKVIAARGEEIDVLLSAGRYWLK